MRFFQVHLETCCSRSNRNKGSTVAEVTARRRTSTRISRRTGGRPARRGYVHRVATKRRCQHSSVPRCDDEGPPACARQETAGRRKEEAVGPGHHGPPVASPEDGEFVPKHDDSQFLEIVRPKAQSSKL